MRASRQWRCRQAANYSEFGSITDGDFDGQPRAQVESSGYRAWARTRAYFLLDAAIDRYCTALGLVGPAVEDDRRPYFALDEPGTVLDRACSSACVDVFLEEVAACGGCTEKGCGLRSAHRDPGRHRKRDFLPGSVGGKGIRYRTDDRPGSVDHCCSCAHDS